MSRMFGIIGALAFAVCIAVSSTGALAHGGGGFHGGYIRGGRFAGPGLGWGYPGWAYGGYGYYGCPWVRRLVPTPYGWRWQLVPVCY